MANTSLLFITIIVFKVRSVFSSKGVVAFVGFIASGKAEKDSRSYGSYTNPNVVYHHYWADASNVFQKLWPLI